jgi:hypothetical protein
MEIYQGKMYPLNLYDEVSAYNCISFRLWALGFGLLGFGLKWALSLRRSLYHVRF